MPSSGRRLQISTSNSTDLCRENHQGVMCFGCLPGAIRRGADKLCEFCTEAEYAEDRGRMAGIFIGIFLFVLLVFTYFCVQSRWRLKKKRAKQVQKKEAAAWDEDSRIGTFDITLKHEEEQESEKRKKSLTKFFQSLDVTVQLRVIIGLFQVSLKQ